MRLYSTSDSIPLPISQAASGRKGQGLFFRFSSEFPAAFISLVRLRPNPSILFLQPLPFPAPACGPTAPRHTGVPSTPSHVSCGQAWVRASLTHSSFLLLSRSAMIFSTELLVISAPFLTVSTIPFTLHQLSDFLLLSTWADIAATT